MKTSVPILHSPPDAFSRKTSTNHHHHHQLGDNSGHATTTTSSSTIYYNKKRISYYFAAWTVVLLYTFSTSGTLRRFLIGDSYYKGTSPSSRTTSNSSSAASGSNDNDDGGENEIRQPFQSFSSEAAAAAHDGTTTTTSSTISETANSTSGNTNTSSTTTTTTSTNTIQQQQQQQASFGDEIERLVKLLSTVKEEKVVETDNDGRKVEPTEPVEKEEKVVDSRTVLERDHDAWYGDIAARRNNSNNNLNVTFRLNHKRIDRLGGNAGRPLFLFAYANCRGYKFCITKGMEGINKIFNFPTCPDNLEDFSPLKGKIPVWAGNSNPVNESGTYVFGADRKFKDDFGLADTIMELDDKCLWSEDFRKLWRDMILQGSKDPSLNTTLTQQDFFSNSKTSTTIAVNIRRGDVIGYKRPIWDEIYVQLIQQLRSAVERTGKTPEVHVFSEDYGAIDPRRNIAMNWSLYDGLVDQFHLAPNMNDHANARSMHNMDVSLNMRDWRHFILADILVVGGTFADIPSYGRPSSPDPLTGSGLTLYPSYSKKKITKHDRTYYVCAWTVENGGRMDQLELVNAPQFLAPPSDNRQLGITTSTTATVNTSGGGSSNNKNKNNNKTTSTSISITEDHYDSKKHLLQEQVHKQHEMIQALQNTIQEEEASFGDDIERLVKLMSEMSSSQAESQEEISTIDDKLARDRDSWYGDIAGKKNHNHQLNVTIKLNHIRIDRLGSNVARPLYLYAYANCKGFKFCIEKGKEGVNKIFNFPSCPDNLEEFSPPRGKLPLGANSNPVKESGTYAFGAAKDFSEYGSLLEVVTQLEYECAFSEDFRRLWQNMIEEASDDPSLNTTLTHQSLFSSGKTTTTIAVNIRRGDIVGYKRPIWDEIYVQILEQLRSAVEQTGKTPEVHLFSEDYGMIDPARNIQMNWSLYDGLVDHFHLAPNMHSFHKMDMSLNIRDWRHFLMADILVVGGTFAEIPSYGRPSSPDPETGAGLTLYPCPNRNQCSNSNKTHYFSSWTVHENKMKSRMDKLELLNMPQILAPMVNGSRQVSNSVAAIDSNAPALPKPLPPVSTGPATVGDTDGSVDDKLARDSDAWYGDIAARRNNSNNNLNVTFRLNHKRIDRLGGNAGRPLFLFAYANCRGYKFCITKGMEGINEIFNFPTCPDNLEAFSPLKGKIPVWAGNSNPVNESGTYVFGADRKYKDDYGLADTIRELDDKCLWSEDFRELWRDMILQGSNDPSLNTTLTQQDLFSNSKISTTIAVNIRRGDIVGYKRPIWDEIYVLLIEQLRSAVEQTGKIPEVHIFSEDYGMIDSNRNIAMNWSLYDGLVDQFHLAPNMQSQRTRHNMDVSLNMRDWRHFLLADILVVGGTFADIPSYGRPSSPDPETGAGLTLYPCYNRNQCSNSNKTHYFSSWTVHENKMKSRMDKLELLNMPQILAPMVNGSRQVSNSVAAIDSNAPALPKPLPPVSTGPATVGDTDGSVDDKLARDSDAWYGDIAARRNNSNNNLNVTFRLNHKRIDRLGGQAGRPLYLFAYANCRGYKFCITKGMEGINEIFNFPTCPDNLEAFSPLKGKIPVWAGNSNPVNESGTYVFGADRKYKDDYGLADTIRELDDKCPWSEDFRMLWRDMILQGSKDPSLNTTLAQQNLFSGSNNSMTIAVNIRRGDVTSYKRAIWDEIYVKVLKQLRTAVVERLGKTPEVHLFSEDYGMIDIDRKISINWSLYEGLVDHFHLAPNMQSQRTRHNMDVALNIRDWRHFVKADILVVGGTFSEIPAYGRPSSPDPVTGSGLTLYPCAGSKNECSRSNKTQYFYGWTVNQDKMKCRMDKLELLNMPQILAPMVNGRPPVSTGAATVGDTNSVVEAGTETSTIDDKLARDRDAWYGDIAGRDNPYNHNLNVTIKLDRQRHDRLGSVVRRPFCLYAYAKCKGYKFCTVKGQEGVTKSLNFPSCPDNLEDFSPTKGHFVANGEINPVKESGTYLFGSQNSGMDDKAIYKAVHELDGKCAFSDDFRQLWGDMITQAPKDPSLNTTLAQQELFSGSETTTTIAVNIRRGDVAVSIYKAIWDEVYVKLLEELRPAVERTGRIPEVHLFSEDYGMIDNERNVSRNWSLYEGLVDHFHLAPKMSYGRFKHRMDVSLNFRDWKHFVAADILVVGGTFSYIPSYGRPSSPDPETGAGLTLYPCLDGNECSSSNKAQYVYGWTEAGGGQMDQLELRNMPEILAPPIKSKSQITKRVATSKQAGDKWCIGVLCS